VGHCRILAALASHFVVHLGVHIPFRISYLGWEKWIEEDALMVHVLVRHKVADYGRWKEAFDSHLSARKRGGEIGFRLFHSVDDPHEIFLLLDWDSAEEARKFLDSSELRERMQQAGVQGAPEIHYLESARAVHRSSAD
jgi:heme-degrading monooxygenase HmoA